MTGAVLYDHTVSICSQMARLALAEKGISYRRRQVDIMQTSEQFEPWYIALNPRAVVPTLAIGDKIVTDTIRIVNRVDQMPGPDLSGGPQTHAWLSEIMSLHYGVLLYSKRLEPDGTAPQIVARGKFLAQLAADRPDIAPLLEARIRGNERLQALMKDPQSVQQHIDAANELIDRMANALGSAEYLSGSAYSLADCFATAALARLTIHGFTPRWLDTPLEDYYARMKTRASFVSAEVIDTGSERDL